MGSLLGPQKGASPEEVEKFKRQSADEPARPAISRVEKTLLTEVIEWRATYINLTFAHFGCPRQLVVTVFRARTMTRWKKEKHYGSSYGSFSKWYAGRLRL